MTDERRDSLPELAPEDAAFVRRVASAYRPPPLSPQRRVAFRSGLDRRLEGERRRAWLPGLAGLAAAGLALALALGGQIPGVDPSAPPPDSPRLQAQETETPEEALLALATWTNDSEGELPDDYEAIASLFLGEV